jgi:hypothetical protein
MNRKLSALSVLLLGSLAGCASAPSRTDAAFGESVRQARAVQIINPDAAARAGDPSVGIDARVSRSAVDLYQDSFKSPQRTFDILGIGGVKGAQ